MAGPVDFDYFLGRKYALLQQQANATTSNAEATMKNAATNALAASAAANLDNTRAKLLPAESAASIGQTLASTGLTNEQAKYFGPVAEANIANTNANTYLTGVQGDVAYNEGVRTREVSPASLEAVMGGRYPGFKLGADVAPAASSTRRNANPPGWVPRFPGDISAQELDRQNGFY